MKDIISLRDLKKCDIEKILEIAEKIQEKPRIDLLKGRVVSALFFEPSTRTRLSFYSAAQRLGAQVLGFDSPDGTSLKKGESLVDTIKMAEAYSDIIVMRHPLDGASRVASEVSRVPVLNAGDGSNQHPSQTLLDLYTIKKEKGRLDKLNIAFVGDLKYGRTVHSLAKAFTNYDVTLYFVAPDQLQIPSYIREDLDKAGIKYSLHKDYREILEEVDVFYMTRIQKERFPDIEDYEKLKGVYVIGRDDIEGYAKEDMILMHPLPRVDEIKKDLDNTKYARYYEQAANGVPVREAMLIKVLNMEGEL